MRVRSLVRAAPALAALCLGAPRSLGATCQPASGYSPCIDVNVLWASPGEQRFFTIANPFRRAPGRVAFGFQGQALFRPLTLELPGPSAEPREVPLVERAFDATWLFDAGLAHGFSLGAAIGVALAQRGTGIEGITSQRGAPLERSVPRDPRVRVVYSHELGTQFAIAPRLELALPLGAEEAFAGAGGLTFAPGLALELGLGRLHVGLDSALRLRHAVELGSGRYGSTLAVALGASLDLLVDARVFLSGEAFVLIPLIDGASARGRALGIESTWIPAEWLLSIGARPLADSRFAIVLGAGSGLALATDEEGGVERRYFAPTTPRLRALLAFRFATR